MKRFNTLVCISHTTVLDFELDFEMVLYIRNRVHVGRGPVHGSSPGTWTGWRIDKAHRKVKLVNEQVLQASFRSKGLMQRSLNSHDCPVTKNDQVFNPIAHQVLIG